MSEPSIAPELPRRPRPVSEPDAGGRTGPEPASSGDLHRGFRPRPFVPAPWLPGPHLQTVGGKLLRRAPPLLRRERIRTVDGDFLDLELSRDPGPDHPIVLVLHGLEGSSRRAYVRVAAGELARRGAFVVALNFRSCSGQPNLLPRFYHSGETEDPAHVLEALRRRYPGRPIGALGFSLGGNVLLKYLGERGAAARRYVSAAATISVPFDLAAGSRAIEAGVMGPLYSRYFLRSLMRKTASKEALLADILDLDRVRAARSLREYDEAATAPLHGFEGADAYYRASSSARFLSGVRVATLLLQARDDPFLPAEALPEQEVWRNPHLLAAFTDAGGHVGFVEGSSPRGAGFWAEAEAARYLLGQLDPR